MLKMKTKTWRNSGPKTKEVTGNSVVTFAENGNGILFIPNSIVHLICKYTIRKQNQFI